MWRRNAYPFFIKKQCRETALFFNCLAFGISSVLLPIFQSSEEESIPINILTINSPPFIKISFIERIGVLYKENTIETTEQRLFIRTIVRQNSTKENKYDIIALITDVQGRW